MFPWYVNELTEYTAEDINETAYVIWFVSKDAAGSAHEILEPLAKEYISKKAEKNMEVKLMFFIASDESDASRDIREKAKLPRRDPVLAIIDVPRNQVRENTLKFQVSITKINFSLTTKVYNIIHVLTCIGHGNEAHAVAKKKCLST